MNLLEYASSITPLTFNDQAPLLAARALVRTQNGATIGAPYGTNEGFQWSTQFLGDVIVYFFELFIHPFTANNLLIVLSLLSAFACMHALIRSLGFSRGIQILGGIAFATCPYFLYRVRSGSQLLYFTFFFPLFFLLYQKKVHPFFLGVFVLVTLYTSNYYGFFLGLWFAALLAAEIIERNTPFRTIIKRAGIFLLPLIIGIIVPFWSLLPYTTHLSGKYTAEAIAERAGTSAPTPYRTLESFIFYTFRPWYFVLPPPDAYLGGSLSRPIYGALENNGNYLTRNFNKEEAGGAYLGLASMLFASLMMWRWIRKKYVLTSLEKRLLTSSVLLLSFSLPPVVTVHGWSFYTPSYLLYYLFPGFRVLVRLAAIFHVVVILLAARGLEPLVTQMPKRKRTALGIIGIGVLLAQNSIRIPFIDRTQSPPDYIQELLFTSEDTLRVALVPNDQFEAAFWLHEYAVPFTNPSGFVSESGTFNADAFSKRITTPQGIEEIQERGVTYLLTFPEALSENKAKETNTLWRRSFGDGKSLPSGAVIYTIPMEKKLMKRNVQ